MKLVGTDTYVSLLYQEFISTILSTFRAHGLLKAKDGLDFRSLRCKRFRAHYTMKMFWAVLRINLDRLSMNLLI
jgi:hypothetical protein